MGRETCSQSIERDLLQGAVVCVCVADAAGSDDESMDESVSECTTARWLSRLENSGECGWVRKTGKLRWMNFGT